MEDNYLNFKTVEEGNTILFILKMELNSNFPLNMKTAMDQAIRHNTLVNKVRKRIEELRHASETCVH